MYVIIVDQVVILRLAARMPKQALALRAGRIPWQISFQDPQEITNFLRSFGKVCKASESVPRSIRVFYSFVGISYFLSKLRKCLRSIFASRAALERL